MKYIFLLLICASNLTAQRNIYGDGSAIIGPKDTVYLYPKVQPLDGAQRPVKYVDIEMSYDSISGYPNGRYVIQVSGDDVWHNYEGDVTYMGYINGTMHTDRIFSLNMLWPRQKVRVMAYTNYGTQSVRLGVKWNLLN
jgi:hypothetical protein